MIAGGSRRDARTTMERVVACGQPLLRVQFPEPATRVRVVAEAGVVVAWVDTLNFRAISALIRKVRRTSA